MQNPPRFIANLIVTHILTVAEKYPPSDFRPFLLGGILANVVGNLPDEYWNEFKKVEPCGKPGCTCCTRTVELVAALEALRNEHKETIEKGPTGGGRFQPITAPASLWPMCQNPSKIVSIGLSRLSFSVHLDVPACA